MPSSNPTVFVTGATGSQGGAVARKLRDLSWNVHAIVRSPDSPPSVSLAAAGVSLTEGDWDNDEALRAGLAGCDKLFLCLMPTPEDPDRERRQAVNILRIAREAGVTQVVATTSLGVSMYETGDPRFQVDGPGSLLYVLVGAKKGVEQAVAEGGFPDGHTFLRPAYFMANFLEPNINNYADITGDEGAWVSVMRHDTRVGLIDHNDIAAYAVAVFKEPARFRDRAVGLVSEFLTPQEMMDQLGTAMGRSLEARFLTDEEISKLDPISVLTKCDTSMRYLEEVVDLKELEAVIPLTSFKAFLTREANHVKKF